MRKNSFVNGAMALVLAVSFAGPAVAESLSETVTRTLNVGAGEKLVLSNVNGSVKVGTWDRPQVRIVAEKHVKTGISASAKDALAQLVVAISQEPGTVRVDTKHPRNSDGVFSWLTGSNVDAHVKYEVTVPRSFNVDLRTVNGSVTLEGVSGSHEIDTTNGSITTKGTSGALRLGTTNGSINAELLSVQPGVEMAMRTTNGRINLSVPSTLRANLSAATTNGSIESEIPITIAGAVSKRSINGKLNGGGPEVKLRTTNGSIRVKSL